MNLQASPGREGSSPYFSRFSKTWNHDSGDLIPPLGLIEQSPTSIRELKEVVEVIKEEKELETEEKDFSNVK